jgi:hypothetical protein
MIIWLASYPKSGNTMLRSMLSTYFFTEDGKFSFNLLKNIIQFPNVNLFRKYDIDTTNENEVLKNYINVQKKINEENKNSIKFIKTHSAPHDINGHKFTDLSNTLGVLYIVRDPRSVVKSFSNHYQLSIEAAAKSLITFSTLGGNTNSNLAANKITTHLGSWSTHYNTWKEFKKTNRYLLIKYEDLVLNTEKTFLNILEFIYSLGKSKLVLDKIKFQNTIETTKFENLQKLERDNTFPEAVKTSNNNSVNFFKYGVNNNLKIKLSDEILQKLEKSFKSEMSEIGYL